MCGKSDRLQSACPCAMIRAMRPRCRHTGAMESRSTFSPIFGNRRLAGQSTERLAAYAAKKTIPNPGTRRPRGGKPVKRHRYKKSVRVTVSILSSLMVVVSVLLMTAGGYVMHAMNLIVGDEEIDGQLCRLAASGRRGSGRQHRHVLQPQRLRQE